MNNLEQRYGSWRIAFGDNLSKNEYFERLRDLSGTGDAVKSVLNYLQSKR
jgi:hypothetical protein